MEKKRRINLSPLAILLLYRLTSVYNGKLVPVEVLSKDLQISAPNIRRLLRELGEYGLVDYMLPAVAKGLGFSEAVVGDLENLDPRERLHYATISREEMMEIPTIRRYWERLEKLRAILRRRSLDDKSVREKEEYLFTETE